MAKALEDALSLIHAAAAGGGPEWDPAEGGLEVGQSSPFRKGVDLIQQGPPYSIRLLHSYLSRLRSGWCQS